MQALEADKIAKNHTAAHMRKRVRNAVVDDLSHSRPFVGLRRTLRQ